MLKRTEFVRKSLLPLVYAGGVVLLTAGYLAAAPEPDREREAPVALQTMPVPETGISDEAAMLLVGSAMIGIAAVVRRAA